MAGNLDLDLDLKLDLDPAESKHGHERGQYLTDVDDFGVVVVVDPFAVVDVDLQNIFQVHMFPGSCNQDK